MLNDNEEQKSYELTVHLGGEDELITIFADGDFGPELRDEGIQFDLMNASLLNNDQTALSNCVYFVDGYSQQDIDEGIHRAGGAAAVLVQREPSFEPTLPVLVIADESFWRTILERNQTLAIRIRSTIVLTDKDEPSSATNDSFDDAQQETGGMNRQQPSDNPNSPASEDVDSFVVVDVPPEGEAHKADAAEPGLANGKPGEVGAIQGANEQEVEVKASQETNVGTLQETGNVDFQPSDNHNNRISGEGDNCDDDEAAHKAEASNYINESTDHASSEEIGMVTTGSQSCDNTNGSVTSVSDISDDKPSNAEEDQPSTDKPAARGSVFSKAKGFVKSFVKEDKWASVLREAQLGVAAAQTKIGNCYYDGTKGVSQDCAKAVEWWHKAADQGDAGAQNRLGDCYYDGRGVPQDHVKAAEWWHKAASYGVAVSQNRLGDSYNDGCGVSQDYAKAAEWWQKAAEQGLAVAQNKLGDCYYDGRGVSQDYAKAAEWWQKAADQGVAVAQNKLGDLYYDGRGVAQDYTMAVELWLKASDQGIAIARKKIGDCYNHGRGVPQDDTKADEWYQKAADSL